MQLCLCKFCSICFPELKQFCSHVKKHQHTANYIFRYVKVQLVLKKTLENIDELSLCVLKASSTRCLWRGRWHYPLHQGSSCWVIEIFSVLFFRVEMCVFVIFCNFIHNGKPDNTLSVLGNSLPNATRWMVSMEEKVHYEPEQLSDFASALAVFFGSYYAFNLEYQESASTTLEMIQR